MNRSSRAATQSAEGTCAVSDGQTSSTSAFLEAERLIDRELARAARRVKWADAVAELCAVATFLLTVLLLAVVADQWIVPGGLPIWARVATFFLLATVFIGGLFWRVLPVVVWKVSPAFAAFMIEQGVPWLRSTLLNFVFLRREAGSSLARCLEAKHRADHVGPSSSQRAEGNRFAVSEASSVEEDLRRKVLVSLGFTAAAQLARVPPHVKVDYSAAIRWAYILLGVFTTSVLYYVLSPKNSAITVQRLARPLADIPPATRVTFREVQPGDVEVEYGSRVVISTHVDGLRENEEVFLFTRAAEAPRWGPPIRLQKVAPSLQYQAFFPPEEGGLRENLDYWLEAGDARTRVFSLRILPPVTIIINRVIIEPPGYTGLPSRILEAVSDFQAIEGSTVRIVVTGSEPLKEGVLLWEEIGGTGRASKGIVKLQLNEAGAWGASLRLPQIGPGVLRSSILRYWFQGVTQSGRKFRDELSRHIDVLPDRPPEVNFADLAGERIQLGLEDRLQFMLRAHDPDFGLAKVELWVASPTLGEQKKLHLPLAGSPEKVVHRWEQRLAFEPRQLGHFSGEELRVWAVAWDTREPEPNRAETAKICISVGSGSPPASIPQGIDSHVPELAARSPDGQTSGHSSDRDNSGLLSESENHGNLAQPTEARGSRDQGEGAPREILELRPLVSQGLMAQQRPGEGSQSLSQESSLPEEVGPNIVHQDRGTPLGISAERHVASAGESPSGLENGATAGSDPKSMEPGPEYADAPAGLPAEEQIASRGNSRLSRSHDGAASRAEEVVSELAGRTRDQSSAEERVGASDARQTTQTAGAIPREGENSPSQSLPSGGNNVDGRVASLPNRPRVNLADPGEVFERILEYLEQNQRLGVNPNNEVGGNLGDQSLSGRENAEGLGSSWQPRDGSVAGGEFFAHHGNRTDQAGGNTSEMGTSPTPRANQGATHNSAAGSGSAEGVSPQSELGRATGAESHSSAVKRPVGEGAGAMSPNLFPKEPGGVGTGTEGQSGRQRDFGRAASAPQPSGVSSDIPSQVSDRGEPAPAGGGISAEFSSERDSGIIGKSQASGDGSQTARTGKNETSAPTPGERLTRSVDGSQELLAREEVISFQADATGQVPAARGASEHRGDGPEKDPPLSDSEDVTPRDSAAGSLAGHLSNEPQVLGGQPQGAVVGLSSPGADPGRGDSRAIPPAPAGPHSPKMSGNDLRGREDSQPSPEALSPSTSTAPSRTQGQLEGDRSGGGGPGGGQRSPQPGAGSEGTTSPQDGGGTPMPLPGGTELSPGQQGQIAVSGDNRGAAKHASGGGLQHSAESGAVGGQAIAAGTGTAGLPSMERNQQSLQFQSGGTNPVRGGTGAPPASPPSPGSSLQPVYQPDEVNLAYAEKVTGLVLEYLRDSVQKGQIEAGLLHSLGWTEEELLDFYQQWVRLREEAGRTGNRLAHEDYRRALQALGLRPGSRGFRPGHLQGPISPVKQLAIPEPPPEWAEYFRAYRARMARGQ